MSCKDKHCHPYPIEPAPFAPGSCDPHPPCPPRPPRPPMPCGPCPPSQYVGSRYVPIFADPIEWDIHKSYESLTIVTHDGESYTSKCNVGPGIDITNTRYWAKTGAYNAQVEQYKNEVKDLSSQVSGFASDNAEFREKIDQFTKDNAEMKNTVAEDKARVDALAERVATAETEIDGLQATTAQHTTEIADLHAKDEDLQRQITSNDNDIAALQAKDVEHDSRLNGIDTKLKSHDTSIAQNTADIAKNTKNIQDNAVAIAQNAQELADHAEQLKDHEARLTSQHKEITANHQAIERNTSDIASLRADLTEDEAKIEANRDAIAHIQEKDVQQDERLDALEQRATTAEGRLDGLDTKTDATNTALTAEIDRAKAAELANGKLIAKNAKELADHTTEIADLHAKDEDLQRQITSNDNDIAALQAKDVEHDSRLNGIDTKLKSHDTSIAQNTADIAKNTKNIQDNAVAIAQNAQELADHAEQLKDHEARLTSQHKEITANHQAIERNTSDIASLRADLTEDEAKIEANRDAIAHIQEKDVQQDERLDALEQRATTAEGRLDGLDTKTDATNTALTAEIDRAKAAELANGKLIAKNAKELADHEKRITVLEGDNTTNKQEIADIKAKNTAQDTAIQQNRDAISHVAESLTGYVKTETYTAGQAAQNAEIAAVRTAAGQANTKIGNWETDHPGQTISQCATSQENELTEHAGSIAKLEMDKAAQDKRLDALENAHHYANIEEAINHKGYLNIVQCTMPFTFTASTVSEAATLTFEHTATVRVQLPPDTVIDDTKTPPAGNLHVSPQIGYIDRAGTYTTFHDGASWPITKAAYITSVKAVDLLVTPSDPIRFNSQPGSTPLWWKLIGYYNR